MPCIDALTFELKTKHELKEIIIEKLGRSKLSTLINYQGAHITIRTQNPTFQVCKVRGVRPSKIIVKFKGTGYKTKGTVTYKVQELY